MKSSEQHWNPLPTAEVHERFPNCQRSSVSSSTKFNQSTKISAWSYSKSTPAYSYITMSNYCSFQHHQSSFYSDTSPFNSHIPWLPRLDSEDLQGRWLAWCCLQSRRHSLPDAQYWRPHITWLDTVRRDSEATDTTQKHVCLCTEDKKHLRNGLLTCTSQDGPKSKV